jgi:phage tail sheath protein FI
MWAVFEPIQPELFVEIREALRSFLRRLYRAGAFRGATEEQAFSARCDLALNPSTFTDLGRVIAEIKVAPSEPVEFLVVQLVLGFDGVTTRET